MPDTQCSVRGFGSFLLEKMYSFTSIQFFKKSFYAVENTAEQHYRLLNTLESINHNGYLYCAFARNILVHMKSLEVRFAL